MAAVRTQRHHSQAAVAAELLVSMGPAMRAAAVRQTVAQAEVRVTMGMVEAVEAATVATAPNLLPPMVLAEVGKELAHQVQARRILVEIMVEEVVALQPSTLDH